MIIILQYGILLCVFMQIVELHCAQCLFPGENV